MKMLACILICLTISLEIYAQNSASGSRSRTEILPSNLSTLEMISNSKTQFQGTNLGQVSCDAHGNLYARKYDDSGSGPALDRTPVQQIKPDGTLSLSFALPRTLSEGIISDFFVASDGSVYLLGWARTNVPDVYGSHVLRFAASGALEADVQLEAGQRFFPSHIAVFRSGEILVTGRQGEMDHSPFTAVFTSAGKLIRTVFEPEDEELRQRAIAGDPDVLARSNFGNEAVDLGGTTQGDDGNVYVLRRTSPALIFVIYSQGIVVRKLRVDAGDSSAFPRTLQAFSGGLVIVFGKPSVGGSRTLKVVSFKGETVARYVLDDTLRLGDLACYTPPTFTFLTPTKDDAEELMEVRRAQPK